MALAWQGLRDTRRIAPCRCERHQPARLAPVPTHARSRLSRSRPRSAPGRSRRPRTARARPAAIRTRFSQRGRSLRLLPGEGPLRLPRDIELAFDGGVALDLAIIGDRDRRALRVGFERELEGLAGDRARQLGLTEKALVS